MYTSKIAQAMCDPEFVVQSLADYTASRVEDYNKILNAVTELVDVPDITVEGDEDVPQITDEQIASVMEKYNLNPNAEMLTSRGYILVKDLLRGYSNDLVGQLNDSTEQVVLQTKTAAGTVFQDLDVNTAVSELNDTLISAVGLKTTCESVIKKFSGDASTALVYYDTTMRSTLDTMKGRVAAVNHYYQDVLNKASSYIDFLQMTYNDLGIDKLSAQESDDIPLNTAIHDITGASPTSCLDFTNIDSAVKSAVNVGCQIVGGLLKTGWNKVSSWFKKVGKYFTETIVDPYDVYKIEGIDAIPNRPHIENAAYVYDWSGWTAVQGASSSDDEITDSLFYFRSLFGEMETDVERISYEKKLLTDGYNMRATTRLKPYPVKTNVFQNVLNILLTHPLVTITDETVDLEPQSTVMVPLSDEIYLNDTAARLEDYLRGLTEDELYCSLDDNETDLYRAFAHGYYLMQIFMQCVYYEFKGQDWGFAVDSVKSHNANQPFAVQGLFTSDTYYPSQAKNIDFLRVSSGYRMVDGEYKFDTCPVAVKQDSTATILLPFCGINPGINALLVVITLARQHARQKNEPTRDVFIPYRKNVERFSQGRYAIKTDTQNTQAFTNLVAIGILIQVIITAVVVALVVKHYVGISLFKKKQMRLARVNSTLWSGDADAIAKLSKKDWRVLRRSTILDNALSAVSTSSPGSGFDRIVEQVTTPDITATILTSIIGQQG